MWGSLGHLACLLSKLPCWTREHRLCVQPTSRDGNSCSQVSTPLWVSGANSWLPIAGRTWNVQSLKSWLLQAGGDWCWMQPQAALDLPPSWASKQTDTLSPFREGCWQPLEVAGNTQVWSLWLAAAGQGCAAGSTLEEMLPSFTKGILVAGNGEGRGGSFSLWCGWTSAVCDGFLLRQALNGNSQGKLACSFWLY